MLEVLLEVLLEVKICQIISVIHLHVSQMSKVETP